MASSEDPALEELLTQFSSLLQSGQYSDLAICSTEGRYAVHKAIVCTQSIFFKTACTGGFKESKSNVVELLDDDPIAVDRMIRYLYTLTYPEEPAEPAEDSKSSPNNLTSPGHSLEQVATDLGEAANTPEDVTLDAVVDTAGEDPMLNEGENHGGNNEDSSQVPTDLEVVDVDRSAVTCDESIKALEQDLQVYVLGDKYGIPDLKKKAAQHFEKVLEDADLTIEIFEIIRSVYSSTIPQDRTLRDIITAKVHSGIEHWVQDEEFMGLLRGEGEFGVDLLSHTVRESSERHEATLATIQHPDYCNICHATLVLKRWVSKRKNVTIKKYCARCEPWQ